MDIIQFLSPHPINYLSRGIDMVDDVIPDEPYLPVEDSGMVGSEATKPSLNRGGNDMEQMSHKLDPGPFR